MCTKKKDVIAEFKSSYGVLGKNYMKWLSQYNMLIKKIEIRN